MLDQECGVEAESVGFYVGLDVLAKAASRVAASGARRLGAAEQAEAHPFGASTGPSFARAPRMFRARLKLNARPLGFSSWDESSAAAEAERGR